MLMALDDSVDGALGEGSDELPDLAIGVAGIRCKFKILLGPVSIGKVAFAIVASMAGDQNCIGPVSAQPRGLVDNNIPIFLKPIFGEQPRREPSSRLRCLNCGQPNHSDLDAVGEGEHRRVFLAGQKFLFSELRPKIGREVRPVLGLHEGKQEGGAEVELMIANG